VVWSDKTRSSAIDERQRDAQYQLKYWPTVVRIKTDRVSAWWALSATATFYSATCIVLYTRRCTRHNYCTASMQCSARHQQTLVQPLSCWCQLDRIWNQPASPTTSVVDDTGYYSASAPSLTRTTVTDGHKFSAVTRLSSKLQKWPWRSFSLSLVMAPFDRPHTISY